MRAHRGRILQDGMVVAEVSSGNLSDVQREIAHYAMMYGQDGPVAAEIRKGKRWVALFVPLNQTPGTQTAQNSNDSSP